jgi:hypothetical protein
MGKFSRWLLPLGMMVTISLFYQNCAGPVQELSSGFDASQPSNETPFAFDASVNRVAYNSCFLSEKDSASQDLRRPTFFTYRVSAVDDPVRGSAGITLRDDFKEYAFDVLPKFLDDDGEKQVKRSDVFTLIKNSNFNINAKLQLGIYSELNTVPRTVRDSEEAFQTKFGALTSDTNLNYILENGYDSRINFFENLPGTSDRSLMLDVGFFDDESVSREVRRRTDFNGTDRDSMLILGYSGITDTETFESEGPGLRFPAFYSPQFSDPLVFGRGFQFDFTYPNLDANLFVDYPTNVLKEVREYDMLVEPQNRSGISTWQCPSALRFMVYNPEHADLDDTITYTDPNGDTREDPHTGGDLVANSCPTYDDILLSTDENYLAQLDIVRDILPAQDWYIHIPSASVPAYQNIQACAVPRRGACYSGAFDVMYRTDIECGVGTPFDCAEYISICYRSSSN